MTVVIYFYCVMKSFSINITFFESFLYQGFFVQERTLPRKNI